MSDVQPTLKQLVRLVKHEHFSPSRGYSLHLKQQVANYVQARRDEGLTWEQIGRDLPVSVNAAQRWRSEQRARIDKPGFVPVQIEVSTPEPTPLCLTSPSGFRLTGLSLDEAAQLLTRLQ